jgi:hypothetical protein
MNTFSLTVNAENSLTARLAFDHAVLLPVFCYDPMTSHHLRRMWQVISILTVEQPEVSRLNTISPGW